MDHSVINPTIVVMGRDMTLAEKFTDAGVRVVQITQGSLWRRTRDVWRLLRHPKPDLVNTMLFWPNVTVRPLARLSGIPVLTTLVNSDYGPSQRESSPHGAWAVRIAQWADALTSRFSSAFRAVSQDVADVMSSRLRLPSSRVTTIHRGRNLDALGRRTTERRETVRRDFDLEGRTVFICIGRQDRQKAQETAVAAIARVSVAHPSATLLLVGRNGEGSDAIRDVLAAQPAGSVDVRILGERSDIGDLLAASDFLLFPSRWEGLPGTVIESMALETPLLLSDIPGSREVTGGHAWFFPVDDVNACATQLERAFVEDYPEDFVRANRERCETMFDVRVIATKVSDLMKTVASR